jgi:uncharacterized NAD(P)/FAD-binding protein YdhS
LTERSEWCSGDAGATIFAVAQDTLLIRRRPAYDPYGEPDPVDLAIVGFGFSGLATLANLTSAGQPLTVAIIADDLRGLGLAYSTREPRHLLNVRAQRMGVWASNPSDFVAWLASSEGARVCARLGVGVPGPDDFAPRAVFGAYLTDVRRRVVERARAIGMRLEWITARAEKIARSDDDYWRITAGARSIPTGMVVLATGNEPTAMSDAVTHLGSADLALRPPRDDGKPAVLVGTGLTAVDALLSLRAGGFAGAVIAASRTGLLPRPHARDTAEMTLCEDAAAAFDGVSSIVRFLRTAAPDGDWRGTLDALRPHTSAVWQRLPQSQQASVVRRWSTWWSVHRHRMAPENAAIVEAELAAGTLRVLAVASVEAAEPRHGGLEVTLTMRDSRAERIRAAALVDCTGSQPDVSDKGQPLLRGLVRDGIVASHHTGLGLVADGHHRVADGVYAMGSLLVGQLWESIAVPELREQAAVIARSALSAQPDLARA